MTQETHKVLKEAVEILNRIQGKDVTHKWFKDLVLKDFHKNQTKVEKKEHDTRA